MTVYVPVLCRLFGHKWDYSHARRRACRRCSALQQCVRVVIPEQRYECSGGVVVQIARTDRDMWMDASETP